MATYEWKVIFTRFVLREWLCAKNGRRKGKKDMICDWGEVKGE